MPAERGEPHDARRREEGQGEEHEPQEHPRREPQQPWQPARHEADGRGGRDGTAGNGVTGDVAVPCELRQQQRDGERRGHQQEGGAGRREDESRDVEVADHRLACGEHQPATGPGCQGREDRDAEKLNEQVEPERRPPGGAQVIPGAGQQAVGHRILPEEGASERTLYRAATRPAPASGTVTRVPRPFHCRGALSSSLPCRAPGSSACGSG